MVGNDSSSSASNTTRIQDHQDSSPDTRNTASPRRRGNAILGLIQFLGKVHTGRACVLSQLRGHNNTEGQSQQWYGGAGTAQAHSSQSEDLQDPG